MSTDISPAGSMEKFRANISIVINVGVAEQVKIVMGLAQGNPCWMVNCSYRLLK